jgi:mannose-6-phosphate isomerase
MFETSNPDRPSPSNMLLTFHSIPFHSTPLSQPEMAIALTPFRGFCGFLPLPHLLLLLSTIPEMRSLIGEAALERLASTIHVGLPPKEGEEGRFAEIESLVRRSKAGEVEVEGKGEVKEINKDQKDALKEVFEILMTASEIKVRTTLRALITRYTRPATPTSSCQTPEERSLVDLVLQLNSQFPDDVGVLCSFVLNVVELEVGKSVFLKADEPHAYISGGEWLTGGGFRKCRGMVELIERFFLALG